MSFSTCLGGISSIYIVLIKIHGPKSQHASDFVLFFYSFWLHFKLTLYKYIWFLILLQSFKVKLKKLRKQNFSRVIVLIRIECKWNHSITASTCRQRLLQQLLQQSTSPPCPRQCQHITRALLAPTRTIPRLLTTVAHHFYSTQNQSYNYFTKSNFTPVQHCQLLPSYSQRPNLPLSPPRIHQLHRLHPLLSTTQV